MSKLTCIFFGEGVSKLRCLMCAEKERVCHQRAAKEKGGDWIGYDSFFKKDWMRYLFKRDQKNSLQPACAQYTQQWPS